jgi:hypothetical protein
MPGISGDRQSWAGSAALCRWPSFHLAFLYPDAAVTELPRWQQRDSRTRTGLIRSLRGLGERGFALLSQRCTTLQNVSASPSRTGDIAKAALVLVQFELKMIG